MMRMSLACSMDRMTKTNQRATKKIWWRSFRMKVLETDGDEYGQDDNDEPESDERRFGGDAWGQS